MKTDDAPVESRPIKFILGNIVERKVGEIIGESALPMDDEHQFDGFPKPSRIDKNVRQFWIK